MSNQITHINLQIDSIKRKLISNYIRLMIVVLAIHSSLFYFMAKNIQLASYVFFGFCIISYTWLIIRKNYSIEKFVHTYLILAPLFGLFIIIVFWKQSVASYMWLLPIPIAAYMFFSKRITIFYTLYIVINIMVAYIVVVEFPINFPIFQNRNQLIFSDTLVFFSNLCVVLLLLYYKDKIKDAETSYKFQSNNASAITTTTPEAPTEEELLKYNALFEEIEKVVKEESHFKELDFSLSKLSALLNTNNLYISKAIKANGYQNFITYLNICRINYVKQLIDEGNLQKTTLMYIYTESGFSSQATFNRVFKQIEGVTPSEYNGNIQRIEDKLDQDIE